MRIKLRLSLILILVFGGLAYLWMNHPHGEVGLDLPDQVPRSADAGQLKREVVPDAVRMPAVAEESAETAPGHAPSATLPPKSLVASQVGVYVKYPSVELQTYYVFLNLGAGTQDELDVQGRFAQHQYDLTDDELQELMEFSRSALKEDLAYQKAIQEEICDARDSYQSIDRFALELKESSRKIDEFQTRLGRESAKELSPVLFAKIDSRIRRQGPQPAVAADFPELFAHQGRELHTEVERFCSYKY